MKPLFRAIVGLVTPTVTFLVAAGALPAASQPMVMIAGTEYPVLFETADVSSQMKQTIVADLSLNLTHLDHVNLVQVPQARTEASQKYGRTVTHWLDEGKEKKYFPDALRKYFGGMVWTNGAYHVVVHEKLVAEYKAATQFETEHADAFRKLSEFLALMGNRHDLEMLAKDPIAAQRLFLFDGEPPAGYNYAQELRGFSRMHIRPPSILDVRAEAHGGKQRVIASTLIWQQEGAARKSMMKGFPLLAFEDGSWRIYIPQLP